MKVSGKLIRELAQLSKTERTVLSSYMDVRKGWREVKHFLERESLRLNKLLNPQEKDYFESSLSLLFDYLNKKEANDFHGPGLAFFADMGTNFTRGVELAEAPELLLAVDDEAIIHPLALQLDEYEPIGVIMIDASCARVLIAAGRVIDDMETYRRKIHHLSKVGGWSQMRYQRRRYKEVQRFAREIREKATEIFNEAGVKRILVAGRNRMITALQQEFPKIWHDKIIATIPWDLDAPDDEFLRKIRPILEDAERNQEKNLLEILVGEVRRGGLAVAGIERTLNALKMSQVDILLVSMGIDIKTSELLTNLAASSGAGVEYVAKENKILAQIGGVGALLRYKT
jgi:peptide chain release factor subunit 1